MSEQFSMPISGNIHWVPSKLNIVHTDTHVPVGADDVYIVIQSNIDLRRKLEILEGLKNLSDHMRDANMMSSSSGPLYAVVDIEGRKANVRQYTDIASVTVTDLVIGVGPNVNQLGAQFSQTLDSAFTMLRDYAKDEFLKKV